MTDRMTNAMRAANGGLLDMLNGDLLDSLPLVVESRACKHCLGERALPGKGAKGLCRRCFGSAAIRATYPPVECRGMAVVPSGRGTNDMTASEGDQGGKDALVSCGWMAA